MARYDLAMMARRQRNVRRSAIALRDIPPPGTLATDLYRSSYFPILETCEAAIPRIIAQYERALAAMVTDSVSDVQAEMDGLEAELRRLVLVLTHRLRRWAFGVERWFRGKWRGAVLSATGVDLQTMIGPEDVRETIETFVARNVALVKDVGAQAQGRISDAVFRGLNLRRAAVDVAKDIQAAVDMGRRRAKNIAADQLSKIASSLAAERRREAGLDTYRHRHSGKLHPREQHKERDGRLYSENPKRVGTKVDGELVHAPVAPEDRAGIPPFCGCREQAVLVFE